MRLAALTIDLDYWQRDPYLVHGFTSRCEAFLKYICNRYPGDIHVYREHNHMVEDLNKLEYKTLINIDQHDDLADDVIDKGTHCHCGNWPFYLKNRRNLEYIWCSDPDSRIYVPGYNAHKFYGFWKYKQKDRIDMDLLRRVDLKYIGICYSAEWVDPVSIADGLCWVLRNRECVIEKLDFNFIMADMLSRASIDVDSFSGSMSSNERITKGACREKSLCL